MKLTDRQRDPDVGGEGSEAFACLFSLTCLRKWKVVLCFLATFREGFGGSYAIYEKYMLQTTYRKFSFLVGGFSGVINVNIGL